VYFTHYLFNTAGESRQLQRTAPYETYWLNSFPHSDERHWDNVGFEVLPSVAVPATNDFSSLAALIHLPALTAPAFVIPLAPTPTPVPSVTSTPLPSNVPAAYSSQYASIMAALTIFKGKLDAQPAPQGNTPVFGAGLALANGQQGTALLNRYAIVGVQQELDHLKALGVQGVTLSLTYPLLTPSYPNSAQYLSYFKSVAQEVANRGMKLVIEIGVPLLNRGSSLSSFILPSFCPYESDWKQVAQTIIDNLSPYYMTIFNEPSTMYEATHYTQFDPHNGPQNALNFITYVLGSSPDPACPANAVTPLRKGSTKIGAGQGNWDSTSYAQGYAQIAGLDAIDLHVYPLVETAQHPFIQNILDVASYARQAGKKLTMTEMWDNKEQASDLATSSLSGTPAIFSRDVFSFWQPTDRLLIAEMVQFARTNPVDYISPFWSLYFEAYLTYTPGSADETTSSYALDSQVLHLQVANLTANGPATQSGMAYQALISSTVGITPVPTPESMATMTPLVPTRAATSTPLSPTNTTTATPLLPTRTTTPTVTPLPTGTAIPTATATRTATPPPVAATATRTATPLPPTLTATATAALTATVTSTPVPATRTATPVVALATAASVVVTAVPGKVVAGHTSPPPKGGGHVPTTLPHLPRTGGGGAAMGGARGWIPIGALLLGLLALVAALARRRASYSRRC